MGEPFATIIDSPSSSYCGLPALPHICLYSKIGIGAFPFEPNLNTLEIITLRAGRFTPAAKVGVAVNILIFPFLNSVSIIVRHL